MGKGSRGRVAWKRERTKKVKERRRKIRKGKEEKQALMQRDQETLQALRSTYARAWGNSREERVIHGTRALLVGLDNPNSMLGGKTALMMACETGSSELARDAAAIPGAKINLVGGKDEEGVWGGSVSFQDAAGKTALDIAMELSGRKAGRAKKSMIAFLEKIGARTAEGPGEADAEASASGRGNSRGLRSGEESMEALGKAITLLKQWRPSGYNTPTIETMIINAIRDVTYVDEKTESGETLLGVACMKQVLPAVEVLVDARDADVNQICRLEVAWEETRDYSPLSAAGIHEYRSADEYATQEGIERLLQKKDAKRTYELERASGET